MSELPTGWIRASLEEIVDILDSRRVPINATERESRQGEIPYFGATGQVGWIDDFLFDQEIILLGEDGAPFLDHAKPKAYLVSGKSWVNNHAHVLVATGDVSNRFVLHQLNTISYDEYVSGTTRLKLPQGPMKRIPLAVAPAPEQVRIVDEIEKQFSRLDAAIAALKRVQANLKRYRASVLKAACEGHLVPTEAELARKEGREYEPADKLLERILRERRARWEADTLAKMVASGQPSKDDRWKQKYKEPLVPDLNQLPSLPEGWCWTVADQLCSQVTDGEHIQPPYTALGRPLLTAKHVQDGYVDFKEFGLIAEEDFAKARARCSPRKDDVLIVSVGATTGRAGIVRDEDPFAIVRSVLLLRPLINSTYLLSWVQSPLCQDWIGYASGSTAQAHFYIGDARRMPVALPPEEEQKRIVTKRDEMLTAMESLVSSISKSNKMSQGLRTSILKAAFAGGLVAQNSADEQASVLLERIRGERSVSRPKTTARRRKQEFVHA